MGDTALIAGMGPGFCESLAWILARNGYAVGMFARSASYLDDVETELRAEGHDALAMPTDVTDPESVSASTEEVRSELGPVSALAYTASTVTDDPRDALNPERIESLWQLYAMGGLHCFSAVQEDLTTTNGTMLWFGASPTAGDLAYKAGKGAARGLARGLAERFGPEGVHVAHVIIDGGLRNPDVYEGSGTIDEGDFIDPDGAAATCFHLIDQPATARTFELDLHAEKRSSPR